MSQTKCDCKELKILQQEIEELQNSKNKSTVKAHKDIANDKKEDRQYGFASITAEKSSETGKSLHDLATYVEGFVPEIEDVVKERPALAILGAFALGIIVGHLFSRK